MIDDPTAYWNDFQALSRGLRAAGAPLDALLGAIGLPAFDQLSRHDYEKKPPYETWAELWQVAFEATRDPWLAARVGLNVPFGAFEIVDYAASAAADVGASLAQLSRYLRLITTDLRLSARATPDGGEATLEALAPEAARREASQLYALGIFVSRYAARAVGGFHMERLALGVPDYGPPCPFQPYCRTPVRLGAEQVHFTLSRAVWTRPLKDAQPALGAALHRHAEELISLRGRDDEPLAPFREALRACLTSGDAQAEALARRLGMSLRTLHRRLAALGATYQTLLDDERRELACRRLREPRLSVGEVAWLLGYSEQSAFLRAFKRWTGATPTEFRARAAAADSGA